MLQESRYLRTQGGLFGLHYNNTFISATNWSDIDMEMLHKSVVSKFDKVSSCTINSHWLLYKISRELYHDPQHWPIYSKCVVYTARLANGWNKVTNIDNWQFLVKSNATIPGLKLRYPAQLKTLQNDPTSTSIQLFLIYPYLHLSP